MPKFFTWPFQDMVAGDKPDESVTELQIIGAGMPRTGTALLHAALMILGFGPCHHGSTLPTCPERSIMYLHTVGKPNADYRALMQGYRSTFDTPNCHLVPELMAAFPEAKVILSLRDSGEVWSKSYQSTLGRIGNWKFLVLALPVRSLCLLMLVGYTVLEYRFGKIDRPIFGTVKLYDIHIEWVRSIIPKEKLLEFNVKDGWEPLCKFLGVPVPNAPFPRTNDTASLNKHIDTAVMLGLMSWMAIFAGIAGSVYFLWSARQLTRNNLHRLHDLL